MRRLILCVLLLTAIIPAPTLHAQDISAFARQKDQYLAAANCWQFKFTETGLRMMARDSSTYTGYYRIMRKPEDPVGCWVYLRNDREEVKYNGQQLIRINHINREITITDIRKFGHQQFSRTETFDMIPGFFRNPGQLSRYNPENNPHVRDWEMITDNEETVLTVNFSPNPPTTRSSRSMIFDRKTGLPRRTIQTGEFDGNQEYLTFTIDSLSNRPFSDSCFFLTGKEGPGYTTSMYEPSTITRTPLLKTGATVPSWKGENFDGQTITSESLTGKFVVLDFWFIGCYPCHKMIPVMNKIDSLYKNRGVKVIGVNSSDPDVAGIRKFIQQQHISYEIMRTGKDMPMMLNVFAYPTIYIIDPSGKVVFTEEGYNDNSEQKIIRFLQQVLP